MSGRSSSLVANVPETNETKPIISVTGLNKVYASGHVALRDVNLEIRQGEILALLGPNGAGKTTLIGIICGIVRPSSGLVLADGHDVVRDYRAARKLIGLVPQELSTDAFETVRATVAFSRGLFGHSANPARIEKILRESLKTGADKDAATTVGKLVAERALAAGVTAVVFDRGPYIYHGRVKALAEAAREGGLSF